MKRVCIILLGLSSVLLSNAQEYLGIRNSNYAGVQGLFLNPSSMANSKLKWDVNAISVGTIFDNDFFFIHRKDVPVLGFRKIVNGIINQDIFDNHFDPANPNKQYNIILSGEVVGPSFFTEISKNNWIGFTMATRAYANTANVPGHLAQNLYTDFRDQDLWNRKWNDQSTIFNAMAWMQYGINYATVLKADAKHEWKAGIGINYLQGIAGAYEKNTNLNYEIPDSSTLVLTNSSADYGLMKYDSTKSFASSRNLNHGHGFSANIGFTYVVYRDPTLYTSESQSTMSSYKFKIGVSLIDIGMINFNKNSRAYHIETDSSAFNVPDQTNTNGSTSLNQRLRSVASETDSIRTFTADHFDMALPSAISIQADWNVYKNFFLNATIIKGFNHGSRQGIVRPDTYSLTPRWETSLLEVSVPMSLIYYNRWQPRIGFAVRIGYFYFGGDAPGSLFGLNDFERTDFYAGIHFFPMQLLRKQNYYRCPDIKF